MTAYEESRVLLHQGIKGVIDVIGEEGLVADFLEIMEHWMLVEKMYQPDDVLKSRIREYEMWCEAKEKEAKEGKTKKRKKDKTDEDDGEDAGRLMEEIALLAMRCLRGYESVVSYQSYPAQIDLLISGSTANWVMLMRYLHLDTSYRAIVIEAKNLSKRVDDKQFSRFCYHLQNTFISTAQLGVFFTRFGATGFPTATADPTKESRQRTIRDAQATQIIFHAITKKFVIVLDHNDILKLGEPGYLPRVFEAKIREIEQWSGLETGPINLIDLPSHLAKYF